MMASSPASPQTSKDVDATTPPAIRKTSKMMSVKVLFLDSSNHVFQVPSKALGQHLFDKVCKYLNLLEVDYFGLEYMDDKNTKYWLDALKPMCRQTSMSSTITLQFCVKFYTPDPVQLEDEYTRYLFSLQIKRDLANGLLQCNDNTAALMVSYIIQADRGDYDDDDEQSAILFLSANKFVPYQDNELQRKIVENHRKLIGQTPAEADLNLLETARRCELYGIRMTPAKDHEGVPLNLAAAHLGVLVFQNFTKINTFSWAKIRKLSFKRKRFLIKLHPEGYGYYKDTVEFFFEGRNECKNFWKKCIENHTFFRCTDAKAGMRQKPKIFSRGSSFRYSGRTQKQVSDFVRENYVKRQPFERSTSLRTTPSSPSEPVGSSISAQPLLPITSSMSCGSMADAALSLPSPKNQMSASEPTTPHVTQESKQSLTNGNVVIDQPDSEEMRRQVSPVNDDAGMYAPNGNVTDLRNSAISEKNNNSLDKDLSHILKNSTAETLYEPPLESTVSDAPENKTVEKDLNNIPLTKASSSELYQNYNENYEKESMTSKDTNSVLDKQWGSLSDNLSLSPNEQSSGNFEPNESSPSVSLEESTSPSYDNGLHSFGFSSSNMDNFMSLSESRFLNHKRTPGDKAYSIAKELLMTERTYRRDLEILNVVFRDEFNKQGSMPTEAVETLLSIIDPLYEVHCSLLRELEQRMATWEGRPVKVIQNSNQSIGQILYDHSYVTKLYDAYIVKLPHVLDLLIEALNGNQRFANFYQRFETHKVCYLPLTSFLLRPLYRVFYYTSVLPSLMQQYGSDHENYKSCQDALKKLSEREITDEALIYSIVNYVKLAELQRNLLGFENLLKSERAFIREGCLQKLSKNGCQQRMFFLFSDLLLYAARMPTGQLHFKAQGRLSLEDLEVQSLDPQPEANHCFSISRDSKTILLAAGSDREKCKWLTDLCDVITSAKSRGMKDDYSSQFFNTSSEGHSESENPLEDTNAVSDEKSISNIVNTTIHVCWHRNISVGQLDLVLAAKHSLSGYLLRKFKNNSGWQKLWVVLSNLCLFFYKTHFDESPLANLPLAGYKVDVPSQDDPITKDYVFKLQYKSHSYFFQAEGQHSFDRWMKVIRLSTLQDEAKTHL